jgi:hypothetical protein
VKKDPTGWIHVAKDGSSRNIWWSVGFSSIMTALPCGSSASTSSRSFSSGMITCRSTIRKGSPNSDGSLTTQSSRFSPRSFSCFDLVSVTLTDPLGVIF